MSFDFNKPFSITYDPNTFCKCVTDFNPKVGCRVDATTNAIVLTATKHTPKWALTDYRLNFHPSIFHEEEITLTTKKVSLFFRPYSHLTKEKSLLIEGKTTDEKCFSITVEEKSSHLKFFKCDLFC